MPQHLLAGTVLSTGVSISLQLLLRSRLRPLSSHQPEKQVLLSWDPEVGVTCLEERGRLLLLGQLLAGPPQGNPDRGSHLLPSEGVISMRLWEGQFMNTYS